MEIEREEWRLCLGPVVGFIMRSLVAPLASSKYACKQCAAWMLLNGGHWSAIKRLFDRPNTKTMIYILQRAFCKSFYLTGFL